MFDKIKQMMGDDDPKASTPDAATVAKLRSMLEKGMKHEAYKAYQAATGGSLRDAMNYVGAMEAELLLNRPDIRWGSDWLPTTCPKCGAQLTPDSVQWLDETASSARCSYCRTVLRDDTDDEAEEEAEDEAQDEVPASDKEPEFVTVSASAVGGYAPEQCAYCGGRGRYFTDYCPACGGQGSALVMQPAAPCAKCGGDGKDFATQCPQCHGTGWERAILLTNVPTMPKKIKFVREKCGYCSGSGRDFTKSCPACGGKGAVGVAYPAQKCSNCNGRGKYFTDMCRACGGSGWAHHADL